MIKYIVSGLLLLVIIALLLWISNRNKKATAVLGKEMASASEKERQRIEAGNFSPSPLPDFDYSKWAGEQSLINPIENELDKKIIELCNDFTKYDEVKRNDIRKSITQDNIYTLLVFSKRATIFGIRKKDPSYIYNGLVAVSMIELERCDFRDVYVALGFLNFGIQKLNLDSSAYYRNAIALSEAETGKIIRAFSERSTEDKSLEIISGYIAIETSNGISFIQTNYENYNPHKNLVKTLFDISNYISGDKYQKGEVTIGEKIPLVWVSAENDKHIEGIIDNATGCASLSSSIRNEIDQKGDMQMLLIYLAEFKSSESLQILMEKVNNSMPTSFGRLSFIEGNLFCVVIQRAVMSGVKDFESNKTLVRFEAPMREIIKNSR